MQRVLLWVPVWASYCHPDSEEKANVHSQAPPSPVSGPFLVVGKGLVVGKAVPRAPGRKGKLDIGASRAPWKPPPHPTRAGLLPSSSASRGRNTQVSLRPCLVRWCRGFRGPGEEARVPQGLDKRAGGEACAGRLAVCSWSGHAWALCGGGVRPEVQDFCPPGRRVLGEEVLSGVFLG